jgi:hypothetical protein
MKKVIMMYLLIAVLGLVSVSAQQTWSEYIKRAETMFNNSYDGLKRGHYTTWSLDKWGALLATYEWLEYAYENIYKNAPNLTTQVRNTYRDMYLQRIRMYDELYELLMLTYGGNASAINQITNRWTYWLDHLSKGGTITFN